MSSLLADEQQKEGQLCDQCQQLTSMINFLGRRSVNTYPTEFYCPISHCLMLEPVIDREGNTYERTSIEQWLSQHNTSPITRNSLKVNHLVVNRALFGLMELELTRHGDQPELEKRKVWQQQRDQKKRDSLSRVCLSKSDIIARVNTAENKRRIDCTNGVYYGQMKFMKSNGFGTFIFANGAKYVGEWKNGNMHGQGTYTLANGTIIHRGEWETMKKIINTIME